MFDSKEEERIAFLTMWRDMLNGIISDFLQGIVKATKELSRKDLTAENIMRMGIRCSVKRFVVSDPPNGKLKPFETSQYFLGKHLGECKDKWAENIFKKEWVKIEKIGNEIVLNWGITSNKSFHRVSYAHPYNVLGSQFLPR